MPGLNRRTLEFSDGVPGASVRRPALDEIVACGASVHLEQMAHDHWWMGLEAGGKYFHLNFGIQDGRLWVHLSDQGEENTEWEGDSRERPIPGFNGADDRT